jgi:hypothetical protein
MKRPLADKRLIGPLIFSTSSSCNVILHVPNPDISRQLDSKFNDDFELDIESESDSNETRIIFNNEQLISTMYFGIIDIVGEPPRGTYVSSTSGTIALQIEDTYDSIRGSVEILDSFLGSMESEAEKRDVDVDTSRGSALPNNAKIRNTVEDALDDIASGMDTISSYRVYWSDDGYEARFIWSDNSMDLSLALDVIAEMTNITEEFGGAGRDLQTVHGKAVCI